jgi:hypothetical protein
MPSSSDDNDAFPMLTVLLPTYIDCHRCPVVPNVHDYVGSGIKLP